jgi:hypothetical protein
VVAARAWRAVCTQRRQINPSLAKDVRRAPKGARAEMTFTQFSGEMSLDSVTSFLRPHALPDAREIVLANQTHLQSECSDDVMGSWLCAILLTNGPPSVEMRPRDMDTDILTAMKRLSISFSGDSIKIMAVDALKFPSARKAFNVKVLHAAQRSLPICLPRHTCSP